MCEESQKDNLNIYWLLKPIYYLLRIVGVIVFKLNGQQKSVCLKIFSIFLVTVHFVACFWITFYYVKVEGILVEASMLISAGFRVYICSEMIYVLWSGIYFKIKHKMVVTQIRNLHELEENLKECEINLDYFKIRRKIIIMEIVFVVIKHFLLIVGYYIQPNLSVFEQIVLNILSAIVYLSPTSVTLTYNVLFLIIASMLEKINEKFCKILNEEIDDVPIKIHKLAKIHQEVTDYTMEISNFFGFYILISFLRHFTLIILQVFSFLLMFINQAIVYPVLVMFIGMVIDAGLTIHVSIDIGNKCLKEWQKTKSILIEFVLNYKDTDIRREITALSLQLFHEYPAISPLGFFTVDTKLAFAMISAISMYTIILIQFDTKVDIVGAFFNSTKIKEV